MLEMYFVKPETIDRVRACWVGHEVETYVAWLSEHGYRPKSIWRRVPLLVAFAELAQAAGAKTVQDLPDHVEGFVAERVRTGNGGEARPTAMRSGSSAARSSRCFA